MEAPLDRQKSHSLRQNRQHGGADDDLQNAASFNTIRLAGVPSSIRHAQATEGLRVTGAEGGTIGIIAREVALDVSDSVYTPDVAQHIPGVSNIAADQLSRLHQPQKTGKIPSYLKDTDRTVIPARQRSWWRALPAQP